MQVIDGCSACANMAYNFSEMSFVYPITPSSSMASTIDSLASKNTKNIFNDTVKVVEMQSEAGAAGSLHGALNSGILGTTFTASQGLLLMIPNMYKMAGECLPAVIHVAARSLATHALSIFGDHQDIYAIRSTGFCMLASTNVQDTYNLAAVAHLSAIDSSLPFIHFFDGFRTSHEYNQINFIDQDKIKKLVNYDNILKFRDRALNSGKAITKGTAQNEDIYFQVTESRNLDYQKAEDIVNENMQKINKLAKTNYAPFNYYGNPKATKVIVAMGSVCDTIKKTIDALNIDEYGLIEVHLYRPFSAKYLLEVLPKNTKRIAVLDRTKEFGSVGEPLYQDVVSVLQGKGIEIVGGRYGLSSKNTMPNDIYDVYKMLDNKLKNNFTIGIKDDVTNLSLKHERLDIQDNFRELKIFGFGSDGLVSASKDLLKIIGEKKYVQGYFEYDSKKSSGVTISHLRTAKKPINAPYYVTHPKLIVISKDEYFHKFDMLDGLTENGSLLINTTKDEQNLNAFLPSKVKEELLNKNIKVYTINAELLAAKNGIKGKTSLILEAIILKLLGIRNYKTILIDNVKTRFLTKGTDIINANINCINESINNLKEITISETKGLDIKKENNIFDLINRREGNNLPVSAFLDYKDGTFPGGTTAREKRNLSELVPKWDKDKCIECGMCALACPHSVIRPFLLDKLSKYNELAKNSQTPDKDYLISCSEADCTSCGLCINVCPVKCLSFGEKESEKQLMANDLFENHINPKVEPTTIKNVELNEPLIEFPGACAGCGETPYIKLLTQIVGKKLVIANATGCSSIYGGSCPNTPYKVSWSNSLFEDAAEYGFGILQSYNKLHERIKKELSTNKHKEAKKLYKYLIENEKDYEKINLKKEEIAKYISKDLKDYITPKSVWTIGGDGWAYDIGFGGLDHILSSNENAKILVLDTEVYSNTGGQASKSSRLGAVAEFADMGKNTNKKDLFKIAMTYPNCYVAQISLGANMLNAIEVLKEAEEHNGPAIIIAYCPCIEQGIKGGMSNSFKEEQLAVKCGYVLLMKYKNNELTLYTKNPYFDAYDEFLSNEVRYNALKIKNKKIADQLLELNKQAAIERFNYYQNISKK